jgi:hypothetical protein
VGEEKSRTLPILAEPETNMNEPMEMWKEIRKYLSRCLKYAITQMNILFPSKFEDVFCGFESIFECRNFCFKRCVLFFKIAGEGSEPVGIRKKDPESSSPSIRGMNISPRDECIMVSRQTCVQKVVFLIIEIKFALGRH